jgi:hypothetical protein
MESSGKTFESINLRSKWHILGDAKCSTQIIS